MSDVMNIGNMFSLDDSTPSNEGVESFMDDDSKKNNDFTKDEVKKAIEEETGVMGVPDINFTPFVDYTKFNNVDIERIRRIYHHKLSLEHLQTIDRHYGQILQKDIPHFKYTPNYYTRFPSKTYFNESLEEINGVVQGEYENGVKQAIMNLESTICGEDRLDIKEKYLKAIQEEEDQYKKLLETIGNTSWDTEDIDDKIVLLISPKLFEDIIFDGIEKEDEKVFSESVIITHREMDNIIAKIKENPYPDMRKALEWVFHYSNTFLQSLKADDIVSNKKDYVIMASNYCIHVLKEIDQVLLNRKEVHFTVLNHFNNHSKEEK